NGRGFPWMPPGLTTPPSQFWRKFGSVRGPGPALVFDVVRYGASNSGQSHHVYPSGVAALAVGGSGAAGAPSAQLLFVVFFPPRVQMLQVTDPAARCGFAPSVG